MVVRTSGAADEHLDGALGPEVGFHDVMQAFCSIDVHEDRLRSRCDVALSCSRRARLHRIELHARDARTALLPMTSASGLSCLIDCPLISALRPPPCALFTSFQKALLWPAHPFVKGREDRIVFPLCVPFLSGTCAVCRSSSDATLRARDSAFIGVARLLWCRRADRIPLLRQSANAGELLCSKHKCFLCTLIPSRHHLLRRLFESVLTHPLTAPHQLIASDNAIISGSAWENPPRGWH